MGTVPMPQERAGAVTRSLEELAGQWHRAQLNQGPARAAGAVSPWEKGL